MTEAGALFLIVNDDTYDDNQGHFTAEVDSSPGSDDDDSGDDDDDDDDDNNDGIPDVGDDDGGDDMFAYGEVDSGGTCGC